jgi:hypothetical protein
MTENLYKCDLCSARFRNGDKCYTYETPSTGTLEQAQAGEAYFCDDPEWALCVNCHALTLANEEGQSTDVKWALAILDLWRQHNYITILPDTVENRAEAQQWNRDSMDTAARMITSFLQFHTPGAQYDEIIDYEDEEES